MISIISGKFKNQKIETVEDLRTKYTPSKVKNALFSIIESKIPIQNSSFLDLCAGSGQIGIEALSRGASSVTFVDISPHSIKTLKNNAEKLKISDDVRIFKKDVIRFIKKPPEIYDIVFIDPPFTEGLFNKIINNLLETESILTEYGRIIIESKDVFKITQNKKYEIEDEYNYSSIKIAILKRKG